MAYSKNDAKMTQGFAIVCMVVLHLFCRQGADVLGTPLLWINETTPFVYWFGFFSEICVPLYTLCMGYAQELLFEKGKSNVRDRAKRVLNLMINYWVILFLFSVIGLIVDPNGGMPGSFGDFLKAFVLLKSYNGAWWFLHTYVFLLFLPPKVLLFPARNLKPWVCVVLCIGLYTGMYFFDRFKLLDGWQWHPILMYVVTELYNAVRVLPYVWIGALFCKYSVMDYIMQWWQLHVSLKFRNLLLAGGAVCLFLATNIVHKALAMGFVAVAVFVLFNLWKKSRFTESVLLFLGNHSTNIWLVHMFFYAYIFTGLVECARYPLPMLLFMFALCIATSYIIKGLLHVGNKGVSYIRKCAR